MVTYQGALVTYPGFEDVADLEVKELIGAKAATDAAGIITFKAKQPIDLCRLCYLSQSANSVFLLQQRLSSTAAITDFSQSLHINPFDLGKREYTVFGSSGGVEGNLAYLLLRNAGYDGRKFLFDPFTRSGAIAIEAALFSSGFPVNYYRKDALASALSRLKPFSGVDFNKFFAVAEKETAAAAAKRAKISKPKILSSSQSMQNVRFAEKNAKLAGVNKLIKFSRLDVEWLDAKLEEHSIDLAVSYPPQFRSGNDNFSAAENEKLKKMYKEFFYHADYFLANKGAVTLLLKPEWGEIAAASSNQKFKPTLLRKVQIGSAFFELVSFTKL